MGNKESKSSVDEEDLLTLYNSFGIPVCLNALRRWKHPFNVDDCEHSIQEKISFTFP